MPATTAEALKARPAAPGPKIPYREEIDHEVFPVPVTARGVMYVGPEGALIRHQMAPSEEIAEIDADVVRVIKIGEGAESAESAIKIDPERAPLLTLLRRMLQDEPVDIDLTTELHSVEEGWRLDVVTPEDSSIHVFGCGSELKAIELDLNDLSRRRITFETP